MRTTAAPDPALHTLGTAQETWDQFWGDRQSAEEFYPAVTDILAHLLPLLGDPAGKHILEVGAGTGREGHRLAAMGAHVTLLDTSDQALRISRTISDLPTFVRGDAIDSPFGTGTFDAVYHQGLLEHFRDPLPLLRENVRILKPGGILLVDVPQRFHVYTLIKHAMMMTGTWFAGWETSFGAGQLEQLVRGVGLVPCKRYGSFMKPSLSYRVLREVARRVGVRLPLDPMPEALRAQRNQLLEAVERRRWAHHLTLCVGMVARKPLDASEAVD